MSKRVFIFTLFAVMLLCTPVLWAQHYIGVRGGAGGGGVRFKPHVEKSFLWGSPVGGVAYKYYGGDRFVGGVEVDVNLVKKGYRTYPRVDSDSTYQRTLTAIELPFMWQPHVTFFKNKARFFINAGPYISYNISSREKLTSKKRGLMYDREYKLDNLVDNRLEYGLSCGAGFGVSIKRFDITAEFRYVLGFSDIFKNPNKNPNSSFYESPIDQMNVTIGLFYRINKPKN